MKKPRISTAIIATQFGILAICATFCGWLLYQNWFLKQNAKLLASELGFQRARADFVRGHHWLYEIKLFKVNNEGAVPTDDSAEPTGRHDGPYEIRAVLTADDYPAVCTEIRQILVDAYNQHMHQLYEKPEWFDANGFRLRHSKTNSGATLPVK